MNLKSLIFPGLLCCSILCSALISSCEPDHNDLQPCKTFDYGHVPVMPLPDAPFPFHNGEALIFKDSLNHELRMEMDVAGINSFYTLLSGTSSSSLCDGGIRTIAYLQSFNTTFHSDTSNIELYCSFQANMSESNDTAFFYDGMHPSVRDADNPVMGWHVLISYIANARGNEAYFANHTFLHRYEFADVKNLFGKDFSKVYSKYDEDGSELHFNQELGFVAFRKEQGTLWVLDRIE